MAFFFLVVFFLGLLSVKARSQLEAYFGFDPIRVIVTVEVLYYWLIAPTLAMPGLIQLPFTVVVGTPLD